MNLIQSMRIFVEVVDRQGVGRAAQALQMAPASVSVQISKLEAHLATTLLIRTTRKVIPTDEGEAYYKVCKHVLDEISDIETELKSGKSHPGGRIRVDAADIYISSIIIPVLPEFHERFPDIGIDFFESGHVFDTNPTGADVMLRMQTSLVEETSHVILPLGTTDMVCAASPAYLEEYGTPRQPQDLMQHTCLLWTDPLNGRDWEWMLYRGNETVTLKLPYTFSFSQQVARIDAAVQGLGISYELRCAIAKKLHEGQLRTVLDEWAGLGPQSYIIYDRARESSTKVQAFVGFLCEKYPPGQPMCPPLG